MINELGRLHPEVLSVIGRTSVMRYKDTDTPVDQIGRDLDVNYVLEGSTQREANRVRITTELIKVQDQTTLWGNSFDRELSDILALQSEVAERVAEALALKLLPEEKTRLASIRTLNPEAHDAYLKGTLYWNKLTMKELNIAEYYFQQALKLDSTYAPIYEGLAWVWAARQQMGYATMKEAGPKATEFAFKAIAIDPNSAQAHFALAITKSWIEWDWENARPSWKKTLELIPNHATVQVYYANYLALIGQVNKAIPHSELAVKLDPFNAMIYGMHAANLNYVPRYEDAEAAARTALQLQPDLPIGGSNLIRALVGQGKLDEVIRLEREWFADDPVLAAAYEQGLSENGYKGAQRYIGDIYATWYDEGRIILRAQKPGGRYFEAGEHELAIEWFEKALENHEGNLPYITRPHYYRVLKAYPRYLNILREMGVPTEW
jgi:tetratricopeptide (TPR) repeat protein